MGLLVSTRRASRGLEEVQQPQHFEGLEQLPSSDHENKTTQGLHPSNPPTATALSQDTGLPGDITYLPAT